jgi:hypothetical protein
LTHLTFQVSKTWKVLFVFQDKLSKSWRLRKLSVIDGCDSGVPNVFVTSCSTMADLIKECATKAKNHGQFVSCVSDLTNDWKSAGLITGAQKGAISSCAGKSKIP